MHTVKSIEEMGELDEHEHALKHSHAYTHKHTDMRCL